MLLYIDPGSGSIIVQAFVVGFATLLVFFKSIKNYIVSFFKKSDDENESIDN
jgi:hypothetical protein